MMEEERFLQGERTGEDRGRTTLIEWREANATNFVSSVVL